jgi:hypothetical protein
MEPSWLRASRAGGHSSQRDAGNGWVFAQYLLDNVHRHETIESIAVDKHRVASFEIGGHTSLCADLGKIVGRLEFDVKAILFQVGGIDFAAAALRVLVEDRVNRRRERGQRCCDQREKSGYAKFLFHLGFLSLG